MANHLPLLKVKSPGNVNAFNNFFTEIGSFQLIDTESFRESLIYLPEMDAFSLNFQNAGFRNAFVISNTGLLFYMFLAHLIFLPLVLLLNLIGKICPKLKPVTNKAHTYMFWGGQIRFFMESYLDFCTYSLLNLTELDWSNKFIGVTTCNYVAIFFTVVACGFPIFVLIWYLTRVHLWPTEEFQSKWGEILKDLNIDKDDGKWILILLPLSFFVRRLAFSIVLVFWHTFFWG